MNQLEKQNPDEDPPCCDCNCDQGRGCVYRQAVTPLEDLPYPKRDAVLEALCWVAAAVTVCALAVALGVAG